MERIDRDYIFDLALEDKAYASLLEGISSKRDYRFNIHGPGREMKTFLYSALARHTDHSLLLVVPDELRARKLKRDLTDFCGRGEKAVAIKIFHSDDYNLPEARARNREEEYARLSWLRSALKDDRGIFIVPAAALLSKLMPTESFLKKIKSFEVGHICDPEELVNELVALGYTRAAGADGPGLFAKRGDILDFVLPDQAAFAPEDRSGIRLSFFDREIDAIKSYSLETQRSLKMLDRAELYPARELLKEGEGVLETDISACKKIDPTTSSSLPMAARAGLFDYFNRDHSLIVLDELGAILEMAEGAELSFMTELTVLLEEGKARPVAQDKIFTGDQIKKKLAGLPRLLHFSTLYPEAVEGFSRAEKIQIEGRELPYWKGNEKTFMADLRNYAAEGRKIILTDMEAERKEKILELAGDLAPRLSFADFSFKEGLEFAGANLVLPGLANLFISGLKRRAKKVSKKTLIDFSSDLKVGDYVVHEVHGIGRFQGIQSIENSGLTRDYLKLAYRGADLLYIPVENLDKIEKYLGSQGASPRLSKLGGKDWAERKNRARSGVRELATDLVKLYAQRLTIKGHAFGPDTVWQGEFEDAFEYELTGDQARSMEEIKADMEADKVMDRLLCGDVGFGKTELAFRAMFKAVMDSKQALMLVPTTVLSRQHYETLLERLGDFPVRTALLNRFTPPAQARKIKKSLEEGDLDIIIGTHMLLSEGIKVKNPGLLVIDEEQRFGVDHKEKIKDSYPGVDVLTLTATPIPRTLHMSVSGVRDISLLEDPPPYRRPIRTFVLEYDPVIIREAILREIRDKGQVFYLFNRTAGIRQKAAEIEEMIPGIRVGVAHGQMRKEGLEEAIRSFVEGEKDILVCTTIIESGIDMPRVNTIIVEDSHRFGLAQLYQLKGRVGRSHKQAYAYLTFHPGKTMSEDAQKRLAAIRDFTELGSGVKIALRDLEVRGAGDLLGGRQHGHMDAIGYEMYVRMLKEEVELQTKGVLPEKHEAVVELDVDAHIPKDYIEDETERMLVYRKISDIDSKDSYWDLLDEIEDRFGSLPEKVRLLATVSYIRKLAPRAGFEKIREKHSAYSLDYRKDYSPNPRDVAELLARPSLQGLLVYKAGGAQALTVSKDALGGRQIIYTLFDIIDALTSADDMKAVGT